MKLIERVRNELITPGEQQSPAEGALGSVLQMLEGEFRAQVTPGRVLLARFLLIDIADSLRIDYREFEVPW